MNKFVFALVVSCTASQLSFASAPAQESRPTTPVKTVAEVTLVASPAQSPLRPSVAQQETPPMKKDRANKIARDKKFGRTLFGDNA